jgi:hypothetical protein
MTHAPSTNDRGPWTLPGDPVRSSFDIALQDYLIARAEVERWQRSCEPSMTTGEKLHWGRIWRRRIANSEARLVAALRDCEVEGRA